MFPNPKNVCSEYRVKVAEAGTRNAISMAPKAKEKAAKGGGAAAGAAAAAPRARMPTLAQKLVVAIYVYFIPVFFAINAAMLFSRYTAVPWLV